ncbi:MAG: UrcA family protein [Sphingopyxis sp.]|nr:UrcA family protein [Sphingopyxis sp.]
MAKLSLILIGASSVAGATLAVPAVAEEGDDRRSVVVRYDDLNLASGEGRERLNTRVRVAVQQVCNSRPSSRPTLKERSRSQKCEAQTMAEADVKLAGLLNGGGGTQLADRGQPIVISAP